MPRLACHGAAGRRGQSVTAHTPVAMQQGCPKVATQPGCLQCRRHSRAGCPCLRIMPTSHHHTPWARPTRTTASACALDVPCTLRLMAHCQSMLLNCSSTAVLPLATPQLQTRMLSKTPHCDGPLQNASQCPALQTRFTARDGVSLLSACCTACDRLIRSIACAAWKATPHIHTTVKMGLPCTQSYKVVLDARHALAVDAQHWCQMMRLPTCSEWHVRAATAAAWDPHDCFGHDLQSKL